MLMRLSVIALIVMTLLSQSLAAEASSSVSGLNSPSTVSGVSVMPSLPSSQPVGTVVTWTATATGSGPLEYRFVVHLIGGPTLLARDYEPSNSFTWAPIQEGYYMVEVVVREAPPSTNPPVGANSAPYRIVSRITNGQAVVTPTANPLVFLYSVPPCGTGTVLAIFAAGGATAPTTTPARQCSPTQSSNFYLVGMRSLTVYGVQSKVIRGTTVTTSPVTFFLSGTIPRSFVFPTITEPIPANSATSTRDAVVFHDTTSLGGPFTYPHAFATDLSGNVIWYYNDQVDPEHQYVERPLPGGSVALVLGDSLGAGALVRFVSPAGDPIQETSVGRINEQLTALMTTPADPGTSCGSGLSGQTICNITELHHEINRLPNGHTIVFGYVEKVFPPGTQGSTTGLPVDILTDQVIDLDENLQVDWTWNALDHLPISRPAVLGETCGNGAPGCPTTLLYASQAGGTANDWTHTNAGTYSASDQNLLLSFRHQDWIVKVSYLNATGDGHTIWTLGNGGDFSLVGAAPDETFPWFSHQHGIENLGSTDPIVTFDDGNTRCAGAPAGTCNSRGQVYTLDEVNKVATRVVNADMGNYSAALGWAQTLSNGNYSFTSGFQSIQTGGIAEDQEFSPDGTIQTFAMKDAPALIYRAYRMPTMYSGCCGD
jgi:arylsulfate sulfotransferase